MKDDVAAMESGDRSDFKYADDFVYEGVKVDRVLRDGDTIKVGEVLLTAYHTPGHTRGATTWVLHVAIDGKPYVVVFPDGAGFNPGYRLAKDPIYPGVNDGKTAYTLTLNDVPVDGFWSISVYNAKGFFEKNPLNAYSLNSVTAKPNPDGSFTVRFGGCDAASVNCLPIVAGWNYTVRLNRPRATLLNGTWKLPEAQAVLTR